MLKTLMLLGAVVGAIVIATTSASAAIIQVGYEGVIQNVDAGLAAALPPGTPLVIGAPVVVNYDFESTTADTDALTTSGVYTGALTGFTLMVGGQVFSHEVAGVKNEIDVLVDLLLTIYQPVDSVISSPALPGYAVLEADVIFIAAQGGGLADDSLPLVSPDPLDPNWPTSEAAIYDDMHNLLIDINLTSKCVGACALPAAPVPIGGAPVLVAVMLSAGFGLLARTTRREARA
jgi:hypothetical protein